MVVATCTGRPRCPVVGGEQAVLALVALAIDSHDGIVVRAEAIGQHMSAITRVSNLKERTVVVILVHSKCHHQRLSVGETDTRDTLLCSFLGRQGLLPCKVHADGRRVALGVSLLYHPIVVVAVHPGHAHLGVLGTRDDEGADVVLLGVARDLFAASNLSLVVDGVLPDFVDAVLVVLAVLSGDAQVEVVDIVGVEAHTARVAALGLVPVLVEGVAGILHPGVLPRRAVPAGVPIDVARLGIVDVGIGDDGVLVLVEGNLPHPVADVGGLVDNRGGI